jgi:DNA-binding response OmpR family regulator
LSLTESDKPDIAVLDLNLSGMSTLEILRSLRDISTQPRIVVESHPEALSEPCLNVSAHTAPAIE